MQLPAWLKKLYDWKKHRCLRGQDALVVGLITFNFIGGVTDTVLGHTATCLPILDCAINPLGDARCARHKSNKILQKLSQPETNYLSDDCMEHNTLGLVFHAYVFVIIGAIVGVALQNLWKQLLNESSNPDEAALKEDQKHHKRCCLKIKRVPCSDDSGNKCRGSGAPDNSKNAKRGNYQAIKSQEEEKLVEQPTNNADMAESQEPNIPSTIEKVVQTKLEGNSLDKEEQRREDHDDIEVDVKDGKTGARRSRRTMSREEDEDAQPQTDNRRESVDSSDEQTIQINKLNNWILCTNSLSTILWGVGSYFIITHVFMILKAPFPCYIGENITLSVNYTSISCTIDKEVLSRILYIFCAVYGFLLAAYNCVMITYVIYKIKCKKCPDPLRLRLLLKTETQDVGTNTSTATTGEPSRNETVENPPVTDNRNEVPDTLGETAAQIHVLRDDKTASEVDQVKT